VHNKYRYPTLYQKSETAIGCAHASLNAMPPITFAERPRAKLRPEPMRDPLSPPPKRYEPPRATAKQRRRAGR
jgi:hypothetical protein